VPQGNQIFNAPKRNFKVAHSKAHEDLAEADDKAIKKSRPTRTLEALQAQFKTERTGASLGANRFRVCPG
jgi:hypothetical protein